MPEHIVLDKVEATLQELVEVLRDNQKGFKELGHRLLEGRAKRFFLEETQVCAEYAAELENELHHMGVHDVKVSTTRRTKAHLFWIVLESKLADGDRILLSTAEQSEELAMGAYEEALQDDLPLPLRELLDRHLVHIRRAHDEIKALRDKR